MSKNISTTGNLLKFTLSAGNPDADLVRCLNSLGTKQLQAFPDDEIKSNSRRYVDAFAVAFKMKEDFLFEYCSAMWHVAKYSKFDICRDETGCPKH